MAIRSVLSANAKKMMPFGVSAFDRVSGGIPEGSVSLLYGGPQESCMAAAYAFAASGEMKGKANTIISSLPAEQWTKVAMGCGPSFQSANVRIIQVDLDGLSSQSAREAWGEMLPLMEDIRGQRLVFCPALPWFFFVPEAYQAEYAKAFVAALAELSPGVLLVLPTPRSMQANSLIRHLEDQCQVVVSLAPGKQPRTIRWSTRRLDTAWFLPNLDLADAGLSAVLGTEGSADSEGRPAGAGKQGVCLEFAKLMGINSGDEPLFGKR